MNGPGPGATSLGFDGFEQHNILQQEWLNTKSKLFDEKKLKHPPLQKYTTLPIFTLTIIMSQNPKL